MACQQRLHPSPVRAETATSPPALLRSSKPFALVLAQQVDLVQHLDARLGEESSSPRTFSTCAFCSSP
jgi:hypothetical protein